MKKNLIIILIAIVFPFVLKSQDSLPQIKGAIVSFVPQYMITNGLRIDIEKQIYKQHFIQFCPTFYFSEERENKDFVYTENSYLNLKGVGAHVYHKYFVAPNFKEVSLYMSYGFTYNYFDIDFYDTYLESTIQANATIHKAGFDVIIGYQLFIGDVFSLDMYTGLGTRYSIMNSTGESEDKFNQGILGYNYTGNLMLLGVRIGFLL